MVALFARLLAFVLGALTFFGSVFLMPWPGWTGSDPSGIAVCVLTLLAMAAVFAYISPERGWEWGIWVSLFPLYFFGVLAIRGIVQGICGEAAILQCLVFLAAVALYIVAACLGGYIGSAIRHRRERRELTTRKPTE